MFFVLKKEGLEPKRWEFQPERMLSPEVIEIERRTGMKFPEWLEAFKSGSFLAIHAFLYVMRKRERPGAKWDDIVFTFEEIDFEIDDDDRALVLGKLREKQESGESLTDEESALVEQLSGEVEAGPKA